jgi:uncharacterized phage-associated protein
MRTRFNQKKAAHAACVFLALRGGRMSYLKLIKLLYLLDRTALQRWDRPVTGDRYVSMKLGPVLSNVRDLIVWEQPREQQDLWHRLIRNSDNFEVELAESKVEPDSLSQREIALAEEIFKKFGQMDRWQLAEYTHTLPEWKEPENESSGCPLEYEEILTALGRRPEEVAEICREIRDLNEDASLLGCS